MSKGKIRRPHHNGRGSMKGGANQEVSPCPVRRDRHLNIALASTRYMMYFLYPVYTKVDTPIDLACLIPLPWNPTDTYLQAGQSHLRLAKKKSRLSDGTP